MWEYIGRAIFRSFPMERLNILDQNNFRAQLTVKVSLLKIKMYLKGEIIDVSRPQSLEVMINLKSRGAIIQLSQKVLFSLIAVNGGNTKVTCDVLMEKMVPLFSRILLGKAVTKTAKDTLQGIREYLEQLN